MRIIPFRLLALTSLSIGLTIAASSQPKIEFPEGTTYDFGTIYKGQAVTHHFELKNSGKDTLLITGVSAGCGCTAALVASSRIPPDSSTELKVTFSSGAFSGAVQKTVAVGTNDPGTPNTTIYIKSTVIQILQFDPGALSFNVRADSLYESTVKVKNLSDKPIRILSVEPRFNGLEVKVNKNLIKAGESVELFASLRAKGGSEGYTGGDVILKTDFKPQPEHFLRVMVALHK